LPAQPANKNSAKTAPPEIQVLYQKSLSRLDPPRIAKPAFAREQTKNAPRFANRQEPSTPAKAVSPGFPNDKPGLLGTNTKDTRAPITGAAPLSHMLAHMLARTARAIDRTIAK